MLGAAVFTLSFFGVVVCRPPAGSSSFSSQPLSEQDWETLRRLPAHRETYPANFKQVYVGKDGHIVHGDRPQGHYIKVVGSPLTSDAAVQRVAGEIHKMLRLVPNHIFTNLATKDCGIGIFNSTETLTIFPEYHALADTPQCHGTCSGGCAITCTFDGRKWDTVAGIGGYLAVVLEENVMCIHDSYSNHDNIAVHEFAHTIDLHALNEHEKSRKNNAYQAAKASGVWDSHSYAMSNSLEYFAEASGTFLGVNQFYSAGGMNRCGDDYCQDEMAARDNLEHKDHKLYSLLVHVYTPGNADEPSGLTICPSS